jgi:hypothetical protein
MKRRMQQLMLPNAKRGNLASKRGQNRQRTIANRNDNVFSSSRHPISSNLPIH